MQDLLRGPGPPSFCFWIRRPGILRHPNILEMERFISFGSSKTTLSAVFCWFLGRGSALDRLWSHGEADYKPVRQGLAAGGFQDAWQQAEASKLKKIYLIIIILIIIILIIITCNKRRHAILLIASAHGQIPRRQILRSLLRALRV